MAASGCLAVSADGCTLLRGFGAKGGGWAVGELHFDANFQFITFLVVVFHVDSVKSIHPDKLVGSS